MTWETALRQDRRVGQRRGTAGIFVLGAGLADNHHTPHFIFDEPALVKPAQLCTGPIAAALQLKVDKKTLRFGKGWVSIFGRK